MTSSGKLNELNIADGTVLRLAPTESDGGRR